MREKAKKPINGTLKKTVEVHCAGCEAAVLGLAGNQSEAEKELRQQYGWARRKGLWHCSSCKDDPEMIGARVNG